MQPVLPAEFRHTVLNEEAYRDLWVYKTWNRHCAILRTVGRSAQFDADAYAAEARNRIVDLTRPNILRGLAFGTILELDEVPPHLESLADAVDTRQRSRSVWQWITVLLPRQQIALGIQTWMHVFLTQYQQGILEAHREAGWEVREFKKEKDAVLKFLLTISGRGRSLDYSLRDAQSGDQAPA